MWESWSKYPDTSHTNTHQLHYAREVKKKKKKRQVENKVCVGLNFLLRNFSPVSFLLSDLEHVPLGKEVFILFIYLNHLC